MKRGVFTDRYIQVVQAVEAEYTLYRYKMLSKSRNYIFCKSNEISFYGCVYEYFRYAENIKTKHIDACLKCNGDIIATLYRIYLHREYLKYNQWEDIAEILDVLENEQGKDVT